jgi:hypothetical protein
MAGKVTMVIRVSADGERGRHVATGKNHLEGPLSTSDIAFGPNPSSSTPPTSPRTRVRRSQEREPQKYGWSAKLRYEVEALFISIPFTGLGS